MSSSNRYNRLTFIFPLLGFILSAYALYVEYKHEQDHEYVALCDIDMEKASCSKVFSSEYGKILSYMNLVPKGSQLDLPNAAFGLIIYLVVIVLMKINSAKADLLLLITSTASLLFSAFLAYKLFFVLKDFCVVCVSIYLCNIGIFLSSWLHYGGISKKNKSQ
jgi:vitamin-K-epoxide reductase (warfarin-sensitive)